MIDPSQSSIPAETAVRQRYATAAVSREAALCCPVEYDPDLLRVIPAEVIEKDYGCGDPSRHLNPGETVLDLGSGTGKICFMAAQVVGPTGRVIGVDMTDDMLAVARRNAPVVAERLGFDNVEFRKGRIQDLGLDLERLDAELKKSPITSSDTFLSAQTVAADLRVQQPLVASDSVDVVVSNCVLNLVESADKRALFAEIFRVLRSGGRAVISDIVSDRDVPDHLQEDPMLWSGCLSGALREDLFLRAFEQAGFHGLRLLKRDVDPWQTVDGIEFRSVTVEAFKGAGGNGAALNGAVVYRGPFREVLDDHGNRLRRGERAAVSDETVERLSKAPYAEHFEVIQPKPSFRSGERSLRDDRREQGDFSKESERRAAEPSGPRGSCCDEGGCC